MKALALSKEVGISQFTEALTEQNGKVAQICLMSCHLPLPVSLWA